MTPKRLEPAAPQSQVKHSTTEPLHSQAERMFPVWHLQFMMNLFKHTSFKCSKFSNISLSVLKQNVAYQPLIHKMHVQNSKQGDLYVSS